MGLLFIYNANSGTLNGVLDTAHKLVSPETYQCELCDLTHGAFTEKKEWLRFRESVKTPMQFLHKDEFLKRYKSKWLPQYDFPVVLAVVDSGLEVAISKERLTELQTPEALIKEVREVLRLFNFQDYC
ncbi:GTPase [Dokdonia sp. R86516]|uniref:GTPase n=1 Tax=Dokdonia sp. R86516 TaxID=3093856 RepID=UPI0037CC7BBF